jgi:DNA-directed RNA polymerase specialized sigma24 family protein
MTRAEGRGRNTTEVDTWFEHIEQAAEQRQFEQRTQIIDTPGPAGAAVTVPRRRRSLRTLGEMHVLAVMYPDDAKARERRRRRAADERDEYSFSLMFLPARRQEPTHRKAHSPPLDPGLFDWHVLDTLTIAVPPYLRPVIRRVVVQTAAAAVRRDRQEAERYSGFAVRKLARSDYWQVAAQAIIRALPRLRADRPPTPFLRRVAHREISRARLRDPAARPLGIVQLPAAHRDRLRVLDLDVLDEPSTSAWQNPMLPTSRCEAPLDDLVELRRILQRFSARRRSVLQGIISGYTLGEIAVEIGCSLRTVASEASQAHAALERAGLQITLPRAGRCGSSGNHPSNSPTAVVPSTR